MGKRRIGGDPTVVVAYLRVSTDEQAVSGAGLAAQEVAIRAEVDRRGWTLHAVHTAAGVSVKPLPRGPGFALVLEDVESGRAGGLIVAKLDRLSRSLLDFAALMERAQSCGWNLVAL